MLVAIRRKIRTNERNAGISLGLLLVHVLLLKFPLITLAKCPNWCSQRGICTGPDDDAFCVCEMGYQGDDCGTREFFQNCRENRTLLFPDRYVKTKGLVIANTMHHQNARIGSKKRQCPPAF